MLRRFLFVPILLVGGGVAALLVALGPEPAVQEVTRLPPEVEVRPVRLEDRRVVVRVDGVVRPARATTVAAQVAGQVVWAAEGLREGVRVAAGDELFRIETLAYESAVAEAASRLAQSELQVGVEEAAAALAQEEWAAEGETPAPLALREPQLAAALAAERAARAALRRAERDLENASVRAPHAGIVASRWAEVGEWAAPGAPLVELLSLDRAEVRVSIPDTALEVVDLPFAGAAGQAPPARVTAALGADGATGWTWEGRLTRMEGRMDPATRFFAGVVEVAAGGPGAPPLVAGLFVGVEIEGRLFRGVGAVPRSAFREDGRVLVVDGEDRIRIRAVDAFWSEGEDEILVRSGLADGDRVVVRPPAVVAEGMAVRVASGGGPRP